MSTHDALDIESATLPGDARSVTEPSGAVESARAAATWRQRRFPGIDDAPPQRQPGANGDGVSEGDSTAASASRDAVYRRLLGAADVIAATAAFVITIPRQRRLRALHFAQELQSEARPAHVLG